jgi:hypothetical protein
MPFAVTAQVDPPQAPPQPWNVDPDAAVAVRVTTVFAENDALQVDGQFIPAGELVTVPEPLSWGIT